jgi:LmbE family N-acetylglucosaminyl deacetylase
MKLLYVFPHPDDESFGPLPAMVLQRQAGHDVYLLTLTRGEATSQRHRFGYTQEEMGKIRSRELECAAQVGGLTGLSIREFPDSRLKEVDPREIESAVDEYSREIQPDILITYAVHGISGFHDHLVTHAVVKRVFCELRDDPETPVRRLAFFTVHDPIQPSQSSIALESSREEEIDCVIPTSEAAVDRGREALACYETYQQVIEESRIREQIATDVHFEIFQEDHTPPLDDITGKL